MSPDILVEHFGSITATARAFGIKPPSVSEWVKNGRIPEPRQYQAEVLTDGKLRADRPEHA